MDETSAPRLVGARVKRLEDPRLITGRGLFVDDVAPPHMVHAAFLRSPHAHARIRSIDTRKALEEPGVLAVRVGADLAPRINPIRVGGKLPGQRVIESPPLAADKVCFVGDPVAVVVAEDRYLAEDAVDLIAVEYEVLPAVVDYEKAAETDAPVIHPSIGSNVYFQAQLETGDVEQAFREAELVVRETFRQHRYCHVPMETRGIVADWHETSGVLTVWHSTQGPHLLATYLANILRLPTDRIRVIAQDVGGGFGQKINLYREDVVVVLLAVELGQPVKWIEDRRENLFTASQAREETVRVEAAVSKDGSLLGLKAHIINDIGAYGLYPIPSENWASLVMNHLPGPYKLANYRREITCVVTNKGSLGPYRAPFAVESWVRESLMDAIAKAVGLDPLEVRLRNCIREEDLPYSSPGGLQYHEVTPLETLEKIVEGAQYGRMREEQQEARKQGRYVGIGFGMFIEPTAHGSAYYARRGRKMGGYESATVRVEPSGKVKVFVGVSPHGQGHETTFAQIAADELGIPLEDITVHHGDTYADPFGTGTFASRSAVIGGGAVIRATRDMRDTVLRIAAHMLEANAEDLEIRNRVISVRGAPSKNVPFATVAFTAYFDPTALPQDMEAGLEVTRRYEPPPITFSNGAHLAQVDVDVETGQVKVLGYWACEDCGVMINPMVVEGQIQGGVAQGLGGLLLEHMYYNEDGQPLTGNFMNYLLPTALDVPDVRFEHLETPSSSLGGFKGMGEGGVLGAIPALSNAIADALSPFGVKIRQQPLTPDRILRLIGVIGR
jgi:carbon-monoxide dehydrogenase large subunit